MAQELFTGIGKLKIDIDTIELIKVIEGYGLNRKPINKFMDSYYMNKAHYGRVVYNEKEYLSGASSVPEVAVYFIKEMEISSIPIKNIYLKFYNNKLYSFKSDYSTELTNAMELKYTEFKRSILRDTTQCLAKNTGNRYDLIGSKFYTKWENGNISAESMAGDYYDDHCQKKYISWFTYGKRDVVDVISGKEEEIRKIRKIERERALSDKLKDF